MTVSFGPTDKANLQKKISESLSRTQTGQFDERLVKDCFGTDGKDPNR